MPVWIGASAPKCFSDNPSDRDSHAGQHDDVPGRFGLSQYGMGYAEQIREDVQRQVGRAAGSHKRDAGCKEPKLRLPP